MNLYDANGNEIPISGGETNHWKGKNWFAYGTSITSIAQGKYVPYLAVMSEMVATNKGIPGGGIGNLGSYSQGQVKTAIMNTTDGKTNADLITLETGANDTGANVPLGTIYDTGDTTLCGCLNQCIRYLQANTNAQIVVFPSVATKDIPVDSNKYYEWVKLIKQICEINRVYYLDGDCGLGYAKITKDNPSLYTADNIHQTELGGYVLAEYLWNNIKKIPLWKTSIPNGNG